MSVQTPCSYCHLPVTIAESSADDDSPSDPVYCCFGCRLAAEITHGSGEKGRTTGILTRLGVAIFLSMSVMIFAFYLYSQDLYPPDATSTSPLSHNLSAFLRYASLLFATPVFFLLGLPILNNAVSQWRRGIVSTDTLVVLGVASAFGYSYVATLRETGHTYYETACMVLVLVTLGRWLEAVGKVRATDAVESLATLIPSEITIRRDLDLLTTVHSEDVRISDVVQILAGERIPVDGVIDSGRASIDQQLITGESGPVVMQPGDAVRAGTINLDGVLMVRATAVGAETTLRRLIALLESAKQSKGRYERLADRIARVFLPLTIVLSLIASALGFFRGGVDEAILSALAVLLIACPCALGIATPMAIWVAFGRAAARGVLFRNGEAIEKLARVRAFCFDKTGTLTRGIPEVVSFVAKEDTQTPSLATGHSDSSADASGSAHPPSRPENTTPLDVAIGLARHSRHTAAKAITSYANQSDSSPPKMWNIKTIPGFGVVGDGSFGQACLGNAALMRERGLVLNDQTARALQHAIDQGRSIVCVGWDQAVRGVFALGEHLRDETAATIRALQAMGCRVTILTGDHPHRGEIIAKTLEVETLCEQLPSDKVRFIETLRRETGLVAMVGDGLNDAPALAVADVGLAMGCGADITRESASVCLLGNDLTALPEMLILAQKTVTTIKLNLFWAFFYNVIGLSLAVSGRLSPILAATAMVVSSLFVVAHSLRLRFQSVKSAS